MEHYNWNMKIVCDGSEESYEVPNLIEGEIDKLLKEIYQGEPKEFYTLEVGNVEEQAKAGVSLQQAYGM